MQKAAGLVKVNLLSADTLKLRNFAARFPPPLEAASPAAPPPIRRSLCGRVGAFSTFTHSLSKENPYEFLLLPNDTSV